eukprot:TRINITY_DN11507_c0_g3_i1.p1 TRINITY_DN11507_c0_g3~~TRINITY_DN11507_c0_g3_i1.p1  ORF type:complete len:271 (+),score=84.21 TRINITY_DN11507_c0_g3_i1:126-938(+)
MQSVPQAAVAGAEACSDRQRAGEVAAAAHAQRELAYGLLGKIQADLAMACEAVRAAVEQQRRAELQTEAQHARAKELEGALRDQAAANAELNSQLESSCLERRRLLEQVAELEAAAAADRQRRLSKERRAAEAGYRDAGRTEEKAQEKLPKAESSVAALVAERDELRAALRRVSAEREAAEVRRVAMEKQRDQAQLEAAGGQRFRDQSDELQRQSARIAELESILAMRRQRDRELNDAWCSEQVAAAAQARALPGGAAGAGAPSRAAPPS